MPPSRSRRRAVRFAARVCAATALGAALTAPAWAQRTGDQNTTNQVEVASLTIRGAHAFSASRIKKDVISTAASGFWPWSKTRYFDRATFDADLDRITAFYADQGYPDASITSVDAAISDDQRSVDLTIVIDEGEPVRVASIAFAGFDDALPNGTQTLLNQLPIHANDVLAAQAVTDATNTAARALRNNGYPRAAVRVERDTVADKRVALTFRAAPGKPAVFGDVSINGNASVGDAVIRRVLAVRPGAPFSLTAVQKTQRRLYDLDLFQFATVNPKLDGQDPDVVPVTVSVAEAKHRRLELSGGWGTEEHLRGDLTWRHLNFFGGARTATFEGKWSSLDRGVRTSFTQPYVLWPDTSATLSGQAWFADEPAYQLDTRGGRITVAHDFSRPDPVSGRGATTALSGSLSYDGEVFAISTAALNDLSFRDELIALGLDPRTGIGRTHLMALSLDLRRTTVSDPLDSRQGYVVEGHLERGGGWLPGDYNYVEVTGEGRYFFPLGDRIVVANRVRGGALLKPGTLESDVPFFKRYFLGGSTSLRGWGRFEVAPLSGSGLPLGGHRMLEVSSEVRMQTFGKLGFVAFVDGGDAWNDTWHPKANLRWDAGPGVRYDTPIGPIRADLAFQVTPIDGLLVNGVPEKRHWRVQFSIGQAF
jgi:outer membrane protein insertion porin family/translocation and assembly module TamA